MPASILCSSNPALCLILQVHHFAKSWRSTATVILLNGLLRETSVRNALVVHSDNMASSAWAFSSLSVPDPGQDMSCIFTYQ